MGVLGVADVGCGVLGGGAWLAERGAVGVLGLVGGGDVENTGGVCSVMFQVGKASDVVESVHVVVALPFLGCSDIVGVAVQDVVLFGNTPEVEQGTVEKPEEAGKELVF